MFLQEFLSYLHDDIILKTQTIQRSIEQLLEEMVKHSIPQTLEKQSHDTLRYIVSILNEHDSNHELPLQDIKRWPILIYIISAVICMLCSASFHLFNAHSEKVKKIMNRLDYAGISILINGSFFPAIYYVFYCHDNLVIFYLSAITISCFGVFAVTMSSDFQKAHKRWFRGILFLVLGLFGIIPVIHMSLL